MDSILNTKQGKKHAPAVLKFQKKLFYGPVVHSYLVLPKRKKIASLDFRRQLTVIAAVLIMLASFFAGAWLVLNTPKTQAEIQEQKITEKLQEQSQPLKVVEAYGLGHLILKQTEDDLFSMPLESLEALFEKKRAEMTEALFQSRAEKIKNYLQEKKSPWSGSALTIARQSHWRIILAIAFAESSWGKNCVDNNCSNIGVEPGHKLWRKYPSYDEWIVDFNKLLERRYKDWTLKEMCGVYVQPCNQNWLLATSQVLTELKDSNIQ